MQPEHSPRCWFYSVILMLSIILTLVIVELGLVIIHPIPFSIEANMQFEKDPFTGYRLKPGSSSYFQQRIPARVNANRHRDDLVSIEKTDGVFRILVIGDSFTVGANVAQDNTYSEVLQTLLAGDNATLLKLLMPEVGGWTPFQYAQYYEHYGWEFSPDLIPTGYFVGNDTYNQVKEVDQLRTAILGRRISREAALERFIHFKVFMYIHSKIARLILNKGPTLEDFTRQDCSDFSDQYLRIQRRRLRCHLERTRVREGRAQNGIGQIRRIKKLVDRDSIPLWVVLIPDENQINRNLQQVLLMDKERSEFDFEMPQSMLKEMFAGAEIPLIDLLPHFREDSRCLYMNDSHWTAEGHALAAAVIYEHIIKEKIWPSPTNRSGGRH